jgi:hypothetical protein
MQREFCPAGWRNRVDLGVIEKIAVKWPGRAGQSKINICSIQL